LNPYSKRQPSSYGDVNDDDDDNDRIRVNGRESRGLAHSTSLAAAATGKRMKTGEVTMRKQVGDTESMINEEVGTGWLRKQGEDEWLE